MKKFIFAAVLILAASSVKSVDNLGLFEIDGNINASSSVDWDTVYNDINNGTNNSGAAFLLFLTDDHSVGDNFDISAFNGNDKDSDLISSWTNTGKNIKAKNDIHHAYLAGYTYLGADTGSHQTGDVIIYYGLDGVVSGGAFVTGFWILQDSTIAPVGSGWTGSHTNGDILVLGNFSGNGTFGLEAYVWDSTDPDNLRLIASGTGCNGSNPVVCGNPNPSAIIGTVPWPTTTNPSNSIDTNRFFEAGVNVSAIFRQESLTLPCSNGILFESRSSGSLTATLKDYVMGDYALCGTGSGITVDKTSSTTSATTGDTVTYDVTVTNTGAPPVTLVSLSDTLANLGTDITSTTCGATLFGQSSCTFSYDYTIPANSPNPLINTATANYTQVTGDAVSANDNHSIDMSYLSDISISKSSVNNSYEPGQNDTYTFVVTNDGPDDVTGASLSDLLPNGVNASAGSISCAPANCTSISVTGQQVDITLDIASGTSVTVSVPVTYSADPATY